MVKSPLSVERARNPNGIVMSRVKSVAPVEQRVDIFVKAFRGFLKCGGREVNDLGEGVVDRLAGLSSEQCEAVLESGMKIQRASNCSAVAMSRITEVLRREPRREPLGERYARSRSRGRHKVPKDVQRLMEDRRPRDRLFRGLWVAFRRPLGLSRAVKGSAMCARCCGSAPRPVAKK